MRNSFFRFFRCFSVRPNIAPIHVSLPRASNRVPLHTVYPYLTGLLLSLIEIKYQGSNRNLLKEQMVTMMFFLISKFIYVIARLTLPSDQTSDHYSLDFKVVVCHISGTIACELLLLVLVSPIQCFIINLSSLILVLAIFLCYGHLLKLLNNHVTRRGMEIDSEEEQSDETINVETEVIREITYTEGTQDLFLSFYAS